MKTKIIKKFIIILFCLGYSNYTTAQFYEWAYSPSLSNRGSWGTFQSTDLYGNGYFIGTERPCLLCPFVVIKCFDPTGFIVWTTSFNNGPSTIPTLYSIDADSAGNRYLLLRFQSLPYQLGSLSITDSCVIVKYNNSGTPIKKIALPELFNQLKTDKYGSMFVSNGIKVRKYNKFGNYVWEYLSGFTHNISLDSYNNVFLLGNDNALKLTSAGLFKYLINESGSKTNDSRGRLYIVTSTGLKKYNKGGNLIYSQPGISGTIQVNENGNPFIFSGDTVKKYNVQATNVQWQFDELPSPGIVNKFGDIFLGGSYNIVLDDLKLCPFRLPSVGADASIESTQAWVAKLNGKDAMPYQAAVFTNKVKNFNGNLNELCTSNQIIGVGSLFTYCTNANSSFNINNIFSIEISDNLGGFSNPTNIGEYSTALLPDSILYGTKYQLRVVSSTPNVIYYPNLPSSGFDNDIIIYPNGAKLNITGIHNVCEGSALALNVNVGDPNAWYYSWYKDNNIVAAWSGLNSVLVDSSGHYFVTVHNYACPPRTSDTAQIIFKERPAPVITPSTPQSICQGDSVILHVYDDDMHLIRWKKNGVVIPGEFDSTLVVYEVGNYTSRIINSYGCAKLSSPVNVSMPCRTIDENNTMNVPLNLYPNPTQGAIQLDLSNYDSPIHITIEDMTGQVIYSSKVRGDNQSTVNISLDKFPAALYYIRISSVNHISSGKIIKTN